MTRQLTILVLALACVAASATAAEVEPGQPAPDLDLVTLDGDPVQLSDLRGRVVLAKIGATW